MQHAYNRFSHQKNDSLPKPYYHKRKRSKTNFALLIAMIIGIFVFFYLIVHLLALHGEEGGWAFDHEKSHQLQNKDNKISSSSIKKLLVDPRPKRRKKISDNDRYLAYFPHSGFHNQRISLENALILANLLNRTLLMPPVLLGHVVPWIAFDKLYARVNEATKYELQHCMDIAKDMPLPIECLRAFDYTLLSWDMLLDLDMLSEDVRIVDRWEQTYDYLREEYGIETKDIFFLREKKQYEFRIYDSEKGIIPSGTNWLNALSVDNLKVIAGDRKLLHVGTLFSTTRLKLDNPENMKLKQTIRSKTVFKNDILDSISDKIAENLGGRGNYYGLHIRLSDGVFLENAEKNSYQIYHDLLNMLGVTLSDEELIKFGDIIPFNSDSSKNNKLDKRGVQLKSQHININCKNKLFTKPRFENLNVPIFIATDARSPRSHPLLKRFFNTFPCAFVLNDFEPLLENLQGLYNMEDNVYLTPYFIPFLDAMVAGRAGSDHFIGTPKSTFSGYISRQLGRVYLGQSVIFSTEESV